jgi:heptosyltransferase-2
MSILVRVPNWLGDCVMAQPALAALRAACPDAHLAVEARPGVAPVFRWMPEVDRIHLCPDAGGAANLGGRIRHARGLRRYGFGTGLLLTHSLSTAAMLSLSGIPRRVGSARRGRRWLLTDPVRFDEALATMHQVDQYLALCGPLGAVSPSGEAVPRLRPPAGDPTGEAGGGYAVLAPASAYGPAKNWPPDHFARLAATLARGHGLKVFLTGGPGDAALAETIAEKAAADGVASLAGATSLDGFLHLLAGAQLFVGNDSGASHCAAALGVPSVVIFGSTRPGRTRPRGDRVRCLQDAFACTPCLRRVCPRSEAPMACMEAVTAEGVLDALAGLEALGRAGTGLERSPLPAAQQE